MKDYRQAVKREALNPCFFCLGFYKTTSFLN